jgi:hypothetical protein
MNDTDAHSETNTGSLENAEKLAEYLIANWTPDQVAGFAVKLLGTYPKGEVVEAFRIYMMRFCTRDEHVEFCLHMLGDEAQAWWARKQDHQS